MPHDSGYGCRDSGLGFQVSFEVQELNRSCTRTDRVTHVKAQALQNSEARALTLAHGVSRTTGS